MSVEGLRYIGTLVRTHGLRGGLVLRVAPDVTLKTLPQGTQVYVGYSAAFAQPYVVRRCQPFQRGFLVEFEHVTALRHAQRLREQGVFVESSVLASQTMEQTSEGYAVEEILGCTVLEEATGHRLGIVVDVWLLPANDVWVVETETAYVPLPAVAEVIRRVDVERRCIWVSLLPGLFDIAEPKRIHGTSEVFNDGVDAD